MNKKILVLLATFFNIGKISKAPGTMATVATIPFFILMTGVLKLQSITYMMTVIVVCLVGIFAAQAYESESVEHDAKEIVIDEVAGFLITMTLVPCTWKGILAGFILFRIFDIFKPWPISYLDRKVKGGTGVMVDDIAAGMFANIILQVIINYYPFALN